MRISLSVNTKQCPFILGVSEPADIDEIKIFCEKPMNQQVKNTILLE
jgi:hypothetical protein